MGLKKWYCYLITLIFVNILPAQTNNIWLFGANSGINFNGTPIEYFGSVMNNVEGVANVCDNSGNLLFYTDGVKVWNRNHIQMLNGFGLNGNTSMSQLLIERHPGFANIYYIFYPGLEGSTNFYQYSIVDISLNSGLGDVTLKNIIVDPNFEYCERISSTYHSNGIDKWIITKQSGNNIWNARLFDSSGLLTSVNSSLSFVVPSGSNNKIGCIKVSPLGNKVAATNYVANRLSICDFNNTTGVISNELLITTSNGPYGLEFSPNGRYLYVSYNNGLQLHQYDLCSPNIAASRFTVTTTMGSFVGSIQRAVNNKLYIAQRGFNIHCINTPDLGGASCGYQSSAITLTNQCHFGLPQFLYPLNSTIDYTYTVSCNQVSFVNPICLTNVLWDFDDGTTSTQQNPTHTFLPGTYTVTLTSNGNTVSHIIIINNSVILTPIIH